MNLKKVLLAGTAQLFISSFTMAVGGITTHGGIDFINSVGENVPVEMAIDRILQNSSPEISVCDLYEYGENENQEDWHKDLNGLLAGIYKEAPLLSHEISKVLKEASFVVVNFPEGVSFGYTDDDGRFLNGLKRNGAVYDSINKIIYISQEALQGYYSQEGRGAIFTRILHEAFLSRYNVEKMGSTYHLGKGVMEILKAAKVLSGDVKEDLQGFLKRNGLEKILPSDMVIDRYIFLNDMNFLVANTDYLESHFNHYSCRELRSCIEAKVSSKNEIYRYLNRVGLFSKNEEKNYGYDWRYLGVLEENLGAASFRRTKIRKLIENVPVVCEDRNKLSNEEKTLRITEEVLRISKLEEISRYDKRIIQLFDLANSVPLFLGKEIVYDLLKNKELTSAELALSVRLIGALSLDEESNEEQFWLKAYSLIMDHPSYSTSSNRLYKDDEDLSYNLEIPRDDVSYELVPKIPYYYASERFARISFIGDKIIEKNSVEILSKVALESFVANIAENVTPRNTYIVSNGQKDEVDNDSLIKKTLKILDPFKHKKEIELIGRKVLHDINKYFHRREYRRDIYDGERDEIRETVSLLLEKGVEIERERLERYSPTIENYFKDFFQLP